MFETLEMAPPDPILGLSEAFCNDANPQKINLSVGVYKDADGRFCFLTVMDDQVRSALGVDKIIWIVIGFLQKCDHQIFMEFFTFQFVNAIQ